MTTEREKYYKAPFHETIEIISSRDNFLFMVKLYILYVLIYFPMMTSLPLTIDAELNTISPYAIGWIMQGRWTTYFLTLVMPMPVVPYFTIAVFGLFSSISYNILLISCNLRKDMRTLLAFAVFISFPIWSTLLEFPANTVSAGLALLLCVIAAAELARNPFRFLSLLGQVAAVTLAVGAYQSFVFVYIAFAIGVVLFQDGQIRNTVRLVCIIALVSVLSVISHLIIQTILLEIYEINQQYIGTFFHPLLLINDTITVVMRSLLVFYNIYTGNKDFFGVFLWAVPFIIALSIVSVCHKSLFKGFLLAASFLLPLPLLLISGGWLPFRTLIAIPVSIGICTLFLVQSEWLGVRRMGIFLSAVLALQSAAAISQYQGARILTEKFDQATGAEIYYRISSVAETDGSKTVDFFGALQGPQIYPVIPSTIGNSTAGASFFSWDGGNPQRMLAYMKMLGFSDLNLAPVETRQALKGEYAEMPRWPAPGSVRKLGDIILVKLGDQPGHY